MRLAEIVRARPLVDPSHVGQGPLHVASISPEARPWAVANLWHGGHQRIVLVTASHERALQWQARLAVCGVPGDSIVVLPSGHGGLFLDSPPESVAVSDRIGALLRLGAGPALVIATPQSALERLLPYDVLREARVTLQPGPAESPTETMHRLVRLGYERSDPVRLPGQVAARGGVMDVFPTGRERPVRCEWFGDDIESLRDFDPMTQRSLGACSEVTIFTGRETVLPNDRDSVIEMIRQSLDREAGKLSGEAGERLRALIGADLRSLCAGDQFDRVDLYRPWFYPDSGCILDLLVDEGIAILDDPFELGAIAERAEEELNEALKIRVQRGEALQAPAYDYTVPYQRLGHESFLSLNSGATVPEWLDEGTVVRIGAKGIEGYRGQGAALANAIRNWTDADLLVGIATDQPTRATAMLSEVGLHPTADAEPGALVLLEGNPAGGFVCPDSGVALVTDLEVFGVGRLRVAQRKFNEGVPISTVFDLKPGDFVVHIHYGVGVYRGLVVRETDGVKREFLQLDYSPPDRLFVPADQLDRVQKCLSPEDSPPKINRLVGNDWQKTVGKAREDARALARELVRLYAERKAATRPPTGPDTPELIEFEHTFPWAETHSQLEAIESVKRDLEAPFPMDRLVCGDVGFGKTEVALRAAFKVAHAGRQVVVLCPTTILSEQHFRNFAERFAGFPIQLEYLNRFRSAGEKREIVGRVESGEVDVLIGTHALLSQKLKFRDLGLIIVDEEQKFGVKQKEALRQFRASVDYLSLSATPIPRTLNMALMEIRPISLINDPPPGRLAIRSHVRTFSSEVVREAILRELARGGQVYYVYNKVEGIHHVAERVRQLVPTARVAVGHGQMHEKEIEPVMLGFVAGEIDVLVSTTIVENGLDISNANTLIVENCDRFGLSQLYQLRGRVGRSDVQAYSYFLYSGSKTLTEQAIARLQAVQEFGSLGSGYSLAFRDLQIRGAGELLGAKQSGQMSAVGYDLYTRLIESEVNFLKSFAGSEEPARYQDPLEGLDALPPCDLPVEASIPESYIPDEGQRLYWYREATSCRERTKIGSLAGEIEDRYGRLPVPVQRMFDILSLRLRSAELGLVRVASKGDGITLHLSEDHGLSPRVFSILAEREGTRYESSKLSFRYHGDPVAAAGNMMDSLAQAVLDVEEQRASLARSGTE
ncbi:MAG: transcription-repair coupling factor [Fimbriimonadaceae bacterium]|nr:transcription-repair coupling factor [Fimbriimonadaceae bacterium]